MAVPDWTAPTVWPFQSFPSPQFQPGITLATGTPGLAAACVDGASGLWALSWTGNFWRVLANGSLAVTGTLPSGAVYVGAAAAGSTPYFVAASGRVYSSGATQIGLWPTPAWFLAATGTTLSTVLAASGIGLMNANTGATGLIALPAAITTPSCLVMGAQLGIGGWQTAPPLQGAAAAALDPQVPTALMLVGNGFVRVWTAPSVFSESWTTTQTVTGVANLTGLSWRPDGTQFLATTAASGGAIQVITDTAGVLSLSQTLLIASATSVAVANTSVNAIVAQSGSTSLTTLTASAGVWTSGAVLNALSGMSTIVPYGSTGAVSNYGFGVAFINLTTGGWVLGSTIPLSFVPSVVTVDAFNTVYAAGSGNVAAISPTGVAGLGTWAGGGNPTGIAVHQGRVILAVPANNALYIFGQTAPGTWSQETSAALSLGSQVSLAQSTAQLFILGSGSTIVQGFSGLPYVLTPIRTGAASLWNGTGWTTATLGIGHVPSAVGFDAGGNLVVATIQNTQWTISPSGVAISSGAIQQYAGQTQAVPLGVSALLASGGGLYAATSISGVLEQIK